MTINFPNLVKDIDIQAHKAQRVPNKMDAKRPIPRHIIIKMPKVKGKRGNLKSSKRIEVSYLQATIRLSADFSKEAFQAITDCQEMFQVMKSRDLHTRLLYSAWLSLRI